MGVSSRKVAKKHISIQALSTTKEARILLETGERKVVNTKERVTDINELLIR